MKKTLVALAALAFVGAVSAQSSVTLYGRLDAGIGDVQVDADGALAATAADTGLQVRSGSLSGSRWGMRGSEDLGGGMMANFTLEGGILLDNGTQGNSGRLFGRQAFVGLSGGWGALTIGRQYTHMSGGVWALTGGYANYDAWSSTVDNAGFGNPTSATSDAVRKDNSVNYMTPTMGGFSGQFMWAPGENGISGGRSGSNYYSVGLGYVNGPINVQFAYEWDKRFVGATAVGFDTEQMGIAGAYNFGAFAIQGAYQKGELNTALGTLKDEGWALGANGNLGPVNIAIEWASEESKFGGAKTSDADAFNIRVVYPLSKRTDIYGIYTGGSSELVNNAGSQDLTKYNFGIRHSF